MECCTTNAKLIKSVYICNECGEGEMKPTGICYLVNPARYEHRCEACGSVKDLIKCYPSVIVVS